MTSPFCVFSPNFRPVTCEQERETCCIKILYYSIKMEFQFFKWVRRAETIEQYADGTCIFRVCLAIENLRDLNSWCIRIVNVSSVFQFHRSSQFWYHYARAVELSFLMLYLLKLLSTSIFINGFNLSYN